jgi:hypothetical protein
MRGGGPIEPHVIVPEIMHRVVKSYLGEEAADEELVLPQPRRIMEGGAGLFLPAQLSAGPSTTGDRAR